jgi:hypothetical protein
MCTFIQIIILVVILEIATCIFSICFRPLWMIISLLSRQFHGIHWEGVSFNVIEFVSVCTDDLCLLYFVLEFFSLFWDYRVFFFHFIFENFKIFSFTFKSPWNYVFMIPLLSLLLLLNKWLLLNLFISGWKSESLNLMYLLEASAQVSNSKSDKLIILWCYCFLYKEAINFQKYYY